MQASNRAIRADLMSLSPVSPTEPAGPETPQNAVSKAATLKQPPPAKRKTFPEQVWACLACFRSIPLAIVLISLLALATMAGVLLPQDGLVDTLDIKHQYGTNYRLMKAAGLFNVYSSYWFICLEVLFFFNLLIGSFQWLRPALRAATSRDFCGPEHILASPRRLEFKSNEAFEATVETVRSALKKMRYTVYEAPRLENQPIRLYATKGNFSRLGPVVAHLGILMLLVASVAGAFLGFKAQQLATPGETFSLSETQFFQPNINAKAWLGQIPDWNVKVNDFHMEYYPEFGGPENSPAIKQFHADISIIDAKTKKVLKRQPISVNHPIQLNDLIIYQASFRPTGKLFIQVNGKPMTVETNSEFGSRPVSLTEMPDGRMLMVFPFFAQQDPGVRRNAAMFMLRDPRKPNPSPGQMPPNVRVKEGQQGTLDGMTFGFERAEFATGLQIKQGPEVFWVYLHLRINSEYQSRLLAWVSVTGFALMLVTYFGVNLMGVGLHSYGKIG